MLGELFSGKLVGLIAKTLGYGEKQSILTPLLKRDQVVGALAMSSTDLAEHLIPSVRSLAQHISAALGLAEEYAERAWAEEGLRRVREELEERVSRRTAELAEANEQLRAEICERQQTTDALRDSEERYRRLVDVTFDGVAVHSDGKAVFINPSGARLLGASGAKEILGRDVLDFVHPDYHEKVGERIAQMLESGGAPLAEEVMTRLDGTDIQVEVAGIPVTHEGHPSVQVVFRDISERKRAEEELSRINTMLTSVLSSLADLVFVMKPDGVFLDYQGPPSGPLYVPPQDFLGRRVDEVLPEPLAGRTLKALRVLKREGGVQEFDYSLDVGGAQREWSAKISERKDASGRFVGATAVVREITQRKRAEDALRHRLEFEDLVLRLSTRFVGVQPNELDAELNTALKEMGEFAGIDRSYIFRLRDSGKVGDRTHEWCAEGIEPQMHRFQGVLTGETPWIMRQLQDEGVLHVPRVSDLPEEAAADRAVFESCQTQSLVAVPMLVGQRLAGAVGFDSVREEKDWPEDTVALLKSVGVVFANALAHRRADEALRHALQEWADIFRAIGHPTFVMDAEQTVISANPAAARALGKPAEELVGAKCYKLVHGTDQAVPGCPVGRMLDSGSVETVVMEMEALDRVYLVACTPVVDEDGHVQKIIHIATDVTERRRAEEALRESEGRFRLFFENSPEYCYMVSRDATILDVNGAALQVLSYDKAELVGKPLSSIYAPESQARSGELFDRWMTTGEVREEELVLQTKQGDRRTVLLSAAAVRDDNGRIVHSVSVQRDVTDRRQAQEDLEVRERQLSALTRGCLVLTASLQLDEVLAEIVSLATDVAGADSASVVLVDESGRPAESADNVPGVASIGYRIRDEGLTKWIAVRRRPAVVAQVGEDGRISP